MAEYIDRQKLNQYLHETMSAQTTTAGMAYVKDLWDKVLSLPAADVAPIVRCWECIYKGRVGENVVFCENFERDMMPDDFCSCGEKKNE